MRRILFGFIMGGLVAGVWSCSDDTATDGGADADSDTDGDGDTDADGDADIRSIEFEVDGVDITQDAQISLFLATYPYKDSASPGRHTFSFLIKDNAGNTTEIESFFVKHGSWKSDVTRFSFFGKFFDNLTSRIAQSQ